MQHSINYFDNFSQWTYVPNDTFLHFPNNYEPLLDEIPCVICLGILQNNKLTSCIEKMVNQIKHSNYDCNTISVLLNIPSAVQIRERAVYAYLLQKTTFFSHNNIDIQCIKDVWKWFVSYEIECLTNKRIEALNLLSSLTIDVLISYPQDQEECLELLKNYRTVSDTNLFSSKETLKSVAKKTVDIIMNSIADTHFGDCFKIPPKVPINFAIVDKLIYKHNNIFIGGRYAKLSRHLCQTPWFIQGKYKIETSIQDLICNSIVKYTKAETAKFLSSGREDVDVRMLLLGRPFAIELVNPRITKLSQNDLQDLNEEINKSTKKIQITNGLSILTKNDLRKIKEGEFSKSKTYRALCICKNLVSTSSLICKVQNIRTLEIIQSTPIRVLHRRTLSPRQRIIYELRCRIPNSKEVESYQKNMKDVPDDYLFIVIDLITQAGTYVKEFIHGDFGRTIPNLCSILQTEIDIVALDVTNIAIEWPKPSVI